MTVGENIKAIRKKKGITQKKLGELCGIAESNIRKYENGKQNPKIETIDKIASALGVSIAQIKEDITWNERKNTLEVERMNNEITAIDGFISILVEIYGKITPRTAMGKYGAEIYYIVGENDHQFILHPSDIVTLYNSARAAIPSIVERLKDSRHENEVIKELSDKHNNPLTAMKE